MMMAEQVTITTNAELIVANLIVGRETDWSGLDGSVTDRKKRLMFCGLARLAWKLLKDKRSCHSVEIGERFADGDKSIATSLDQMLKAEKAAYRVWWDMDDKGWKIRYKSEAPSLSKMLLSYKNVVYDERWAATQAVTPSVITVTGGSPTYLYQPEIFPGASAGIVRDVFGNPFRPMCEKVYPNSWITTSLVANLAQTAYNNRLKDGLLDPERLLVLSDALEEAGCQNVHILQHLRDCEKTHVRGCWALDLLLNKE